MSQSDTTPITNEQLDDLERLYRERDEARAALDAFLVVARADWTAATVGPLRKQYRNLPRNHWRTCQKYEDAAKAAAAALVAEVRRLRGAIAKAKGES